MKYPFHLLIISTYAIIIQSKITERPYNIEVLWWQKCGRPKDIIYFDLDVNKYGTALNGTIKMGLPFDEVLNGKISIYSLEGPFRYKTFTLDNKWVHAGTITVQSEFCKFLHYVIPDIFLSFTHAILRSAECPIEEGNYKVQWNFGRVLTIFPELPRGVFLIKVEFLHPNMYLGCAKVVVSIDDVDEDVPSGHKCVC